MILIAGDQAMPQAFVGMPLADILPVNAGEALDSSQGYDLALSAGGTFKSVDAACRSSVTRRTTSGRK